MNIEQMNNNMQSKQVEIMQQPNDQAPQQCNQSTMHEMQPHNQSMNQPMRQPMNPAMNQYVQSSTFPFHSMNMNFNPMHSMMMPPGPMLMNPMMTTSLPLHFNPMHGMMIHPGPMLTNPMMTTTLPLHSTNFNSMHGMMIPPGPMPINPMMATSPMHTQNMNHMMQMNGGLYSVQSDQLPHITSPPTFSSPPVLPIKRASTRNQLSPFELLIQPVFVVICSYLILQDKCTLLSHLSMECKRLFDPATCCRGYVSIYMIKADYPQAVLPHANLLRMVRYAARASVKLQYKSHRRRCVDTMKQIIDHTTHAISSGSLKSLYLAERVGDDRPYMLTRALSLLALTSCRLRELQLELNVFNSSYASYWDDQWKSLKHCLTLRYLCLETYGAPLPTRSLLQSLPENLEEFSFKAEHPQSETISQWEGLLRSSDYLPRLKRFHVVNEHSFSINVASVIASTIMSKTSTIRHIEYWHGISALQYIRYFPLSELDVNGFLSEQCIELFMQCPSDLWPDLTRLTISLQRSSSTGTIALSTFASHRKIIELNLSIQLGSHSSNAASPLTGLSDLRFLRLDFLCSIDSPGIGDTLTDMLPANSWPKLEALHVQYNYMQKYQHQHQAPLMATRTGQLETVLKAANRSHQVQLSDTNQLLTPCLMLAITLHHCREIESLIIVSDPAQNSRSEHVADVQEVFDRYPSDSQQLTKLNHLSVSSLDRCCDAAYDYVMRRLRGAPRLTVAHVWDINASNLRNYSALSLPHTRNAPPLAWTDNNNDNRAKLWNECVHYSHVPSVSSLERRHQLLIRGSQLYKHEYLDESRVFNLPVGEWAPTNLVPLFKPSLDTSKQTLASHLHQMMTWQDREELVRWDASDYTSCTSGVQHSSHQRAGTSCRS